MKNKKSNILIFVIVLACAILYLSPLYFTFISAFKSNGEILNNPVALPKSFLNFDNFIYLFSKTSYPRAFVNSVIITTISELSILIVVPMAAYGIERGNKKYTKLIYVYFLMSMMIPFQAYMIPLFRQMKAMGLFGHLYGPVFVYLPGSVAFGMLLYTSFLKTIPIEVEEAARIDGCGSFRTFWSIVFPLLKPVTATMVVLNGLGIWNDFLMPMLVLPSGKPKTINVEIYAFVDQFASRWDIVFAGVVAGIIPILFVFIALQKYFVKGITAGAAKG